MLPSGLFVFRILSSLIPKSLRAGIALVVTLIFFPLGMSELTNVLLGQANGWDIAKCIGGIIIGGIAGMAFYYFQESDGKPKVGEDLEILAQYHKDKKKNFEVAWSSEDHKPKNEKKN